MHTTSSPISRIILLVLSVGLSCGCGINMTLPATYAPPVAAETPIPLRVGLVLDKKLRQCSFDAIDVHIELGPALAQAAERMTRQAFRDVVVINVDAAPNVEALEVPQGVDALVVPYLKEMSNSYKKINAFQVALLAKVVIKWTIVKDKSVIYTNTFNGEYSKFRAGFDESLSLALKDHFDKAYQGIVTSTWWKSL